mmetsp:Transcript_1066/g.1883  ORF Transcript_1066/g.1883 Transcript_1066/m.1883 type:complete len:94 (+) Transcript_1066:2545-2826(+)
MDVVPCANGDLPKGYLTKPEFIKGLQDTCSFHDVVTEPELEKWFEEADKNDNAQISWDEFEHLCLTRITFRTDFKGKEYVPSCMFGWETAIDE